MFKKKRLSDYELKRQIRIKAMRTALYDMLWHEVEKDKKRPMPRPQVTSDRDWIQEELEEIIHG